MHIVVTDFSTCIKGYYFRLFHLKPLFALQISKFANYAKVFLRKTVTIKHLREMYRFQYFSVKTTSWACFFRSGLKHIFPQQSYKNSSNEDFWEEWIKFGKGGGRIIGLVIWGWFSCY